MTGILRHLLPLAIVAVIGTVLWILTKNFNIIGMMQLDPVAVRAETDRLEADLVGNITALQSLDLNTPLFDLQEYEVLLDKRVDVREIPLQNVSPFGPLE